MDRNMDLPRRRYGSGGIAKKDLELDRSRYNSDLTIICKDGEVYCHHWILAKHSTFLRKLFEESYLLSSVVVEGFTLPGIPPLVRKNSVPVGRQTLHLPDCETAQVESLMDILYTGYTRALGKEQDFDENRKLKLYVLYELLGIDESGGLPLIQFWTKCTPRSTSPRIQINTSTTVFPSTQFKTSISVSPCTQQCTSTTVSPGSEKSTRTTTTSSIQPLYCVTVQPSSLTSPDSETENSTRLVIPVIRPSPEQPNSPSYSPVDTSMFSDQCEDIKPRDIILQPSPSHTPSSSSPFKPASFKTPLKSPEERESLSATNFTVSSALSDSSVPVSSVVPADLQSNPSLGVLRKDDPEHDAITKHGFNSITIKQHKVPEYGIVTDCEKSENVLDKLNDKSEETGNNSKRKRKKSGTKQDEKRKQKDKTPEKKAKKEKKYIKSPERKSRKSKSSKQHESPDKKVLDVSADDLELIISESEAENGDGKKKIKNFDFKTGNKRKKEESDLEISPKHEKTVASVDEKEIKGFTVDSKKEITVKTLKHIPATQIDSNKKKNMAETKNKNKERRPSLPAQEPRFKSVEKSSPGGSDVNQGTVQGPGKIIETDVVSDCSDQLSPETGRSRSSPDGFWSPDDEDDLEKDEDYTPTTKVSRNTGSTGKKRRSAGVADKWITVNPKKNVKKEKRKDDDATTKDKVDEKVLLERFGCKSVQVGIKLKDIPESSHSKSQLISSVFHSKAKSRDVDPEMTEDEGDVIKPPDVLSPLEPLQEICSNSANSSNTKVSSEPKITTETETKIKSEIETKIKSEIDPDFVCPIQPCQKGKKILLSDKKEVLLHLISEHLRKDKFMLYRDYRGLKGVSKCPDCTYEDKSTSKYLQHRAFCHKDLSTKLQKALASKIPDKDEADCYKSVESFLSLHCLEKVEYECRVCKKVYKSFLDMRLHALTRHLRQDPPYTEAESCYSCSTCNSSNTTRKDIEKHLATVHPELVDSLIAKVVQSLTPMCVIKTEIKAEVDLFSTPKIPKGQAGKVGSRNKRKSSHLQYDLFAADIPKKSKLSFPSSSKAAPVESIMTVVSRPDMENVIIPPEFLSSASSNPDHHSDVSSSPELPDKIKEPEPPIPGSGIEPVLESVVNPGPDPSQEPEPDNDVTEPKPELALKPKPKSKTQPANKKSKCKHCDYLVEQQSDFISHLSKFHTKEYPEIQLLEAGVKNFECELCSFRTKKKLEFGVHLLRKHKQITCNVIKNPDSWTKGDLEIGSFSEDIIEIVEPEIYVPLEFSSYGEVDLSIVATTPSPSTEDKDQLCITLEDKEELSDGEIVSDSGENTCDYCDKSFSSPKKTSQHTFFRHISRIDKIWKGLLKEDQHWFECCNCPFRDQKFVEVQVHIHNQHFSILNDQIYKETERRCKEFQIIEPLEIQEDEAEDQATEAVENVPEPMNCNLHLLDKKKLEPVPELEPTPKPETVPETEPVPQSAPVLEPDTVPELEPDHFKCLICSTKSKSLVDLITHVDEHSTTLSAFMANHLCREELRSIESQNSESKVKTKIFGSAGVQMLYCSKPKCLFVERDEHKLQNHLQAHEKAPYICGKCCIDFPSKEENRKHYRSCQFDRYKKWVSDLSSKLGITTVKLEEPEPTISCTHLRSGCTEKFWLKKDMHQHARKCAHRPQTSLVCPCSKKFYYPDHFENHMEEKHPETKVVISRHLSSGLN